MRAVLDACVLYPTLLRDILMGVARGGGFTPLWSARILEEWRRAALRQGGARDGMIAESEVALLRADFPQAEIAPHDAGLEAGLDLPDLADRHVLASAIAGGAGRIITLNLRDFPKPALRDHDIAALSPDDFLMQLWLDDGALIEGAVRAGLARHAARASDPLTPRAALKRARLPRLGKALFGAGQDQA